mgnify:CR=1 FL=1
MIETLETLRYLNAATKHDFALWETICKYSEYKSFARSRGKANSLVYAAQQANIFKQSLEHKHKSEMRMQNLLAELSDYLSEAYTNEDSDLNKLCIYYLQCVQCHIVALWETAATRGIRLNISDMVNEQDTKDYLNAMNSDLCFEELEELSHGKKNRKPKARRTKQQEVRHLESICPLAINDLNAINKYSPDWVLPSKGEGKTSLPLWKLAIVAQVISEKERDFIKKSEKYAIFERHWGLNKRALSNAMRDKDDSLCKSYKQKLNDILKEQSV